MNLNLNITQLELVIFINDYYKQEPQQCKCKLYNII